MHALPGLQYISPRQPPHVPPVQRAYGHARSSSEEHGQPGAAGGPNGRVVDVVDDERGVAHATKEATASAESKRWGVAVLMKSLLHTTRFGF